MRTIQVSTDTKIAVVGDVHEHSRQFLEIWKQCPISDKFRFVSVGDLFDKGFGSQEVEKILEVLRPQIERGHADLLQGNHEIKHIKKAKAAKRLTPMLNWIAEQPLTIVHGGVTPLTTWQDLGSEIETSYVRTIDEQGKMIQLQWISQNGRQILAPRKIGVNWHDLYDGRFGYVASGHAAQKDGVPKFYQYSCNLDTSVYTTGILTCQVFGANGREELITATGPARKPELWKV